MDKKVDFIIVGQGLAGTCLAWHLIEHGKKIAFIDANFKHASSKVAAGLWHGLTFRRLGKTWLADEGIPYLYEHYQKIEKRLGAKLLSEQKVSRIFRNKEQQTLWEAARKEGKLVPFLTSEKREKSLDKEYFDFPFGLDEIEFSGRLNLEAYLNESKTFFKNHYHYLEEDFNWDKWDKLELKYGDLRTLRIIFSEGHQIKNNHIFSYLPVGQTKGEVLHLKPQTRLDNILNSGVFLIQNEQGNWLCGSNFEWNATDYNPTEQARKEIISKLKTYYKGEVELIEQKAGIRPTSPDRRPILGEHPVELHHFCYNGLGTKGVLIAPLVSKVLCNNLIFNEEIPDEMHIKRFEKFHKAVNM